ncbi:MAG: septum formation protein Maf [Actinobacteria bacterium]|nr:septum formation protein Maf [Actinomycetota bacterium]
MLILASRSPQRRAILEQIGVEFEVVESSAEEVESGDPAAVVVENSLLKARAVAAERELAPGDLVLGADTVIAHDGDVIGKPPGTAAARAVMRRLAGTDHQVLGGIAIVGADGSERTVCVATDVSFRPLTDAEIDLYVATGEWQDRSGGYAIQQRGATLVEHIDGDYLNIVGLSVVELLKLAPELRR